MSKTKKTVLSAILCFAMVLCLSVGVMFATPITAYAEIVNDLTVTVPVHVYDILPQGFPSGAPAVVKNGWTNGNSKIVLFQDALYLDNDELLSKYKVLTESDGNYVYIDSENSKYITFCMKDGVLEKINLFGFTSTQNGDYVPQPTIADILGKAESGFPTATSLDVSPEGAWVNSTNTSATVFVYGNFFVFKDWSNPTVQTGPATTSVVAKNGDNYQNPYTNGTITFNMSDGKLVSISFEHIKDTYASLDGTYAAPVSAFAITNGAKIDDKESNHGYISIDKETAAEGETVTITVHPNTGYQLKKLTVLSAISFARPITPEQDQQDKTKYTFKMPDYPIRVTVEFEEKTVTIADILPEGFPTTAETGWINGNGAKMYSDTNENKLVVSGLWNQWYKLTQVVTPSGDNYVIDDGYGFVLTFVMENDTLVKATVAVDNNTFAGTYTAPVTIADILSDGFPTSEDENAPSNAWVNSNNEKMFSYNGDLYVGGESDGDFVLLANTTLTKDGNNFKCTTVDGVTVTFVMDDGALVSIEIQGLTDCAKLNGTYSAPHVHSFKYFASDNVITATCDNTDGKCGLTDCKLTLTLSAPVSLGYDGNAKAFTFADGEADAWTGAGLELPTFEYYLDKPETPWLDGLDGDPIATAEGYVVMIRVGAKAAQVEFSITQAEVEKPQEDTTVFTYNGNPQTYTVASSERYEVSGNTQTVAGTHEVKISLTDTVNYKWKNGDSDNLTYSFVIAKAQVVIPAEDTASFVYTGSPLTYYIEANALYEVTGNVQTYVNEYEVTVSLKDTDNYEWEDSTTDDLTYSFVIEKAQVAIPAEDTASFVYTGNDLTYAIAANEHYTVDGNVKKNAGEYEVTVALKDKDNYEWEDSTTDDRTYSFVIEKAQVAIPAEDTASFVYTGNDLTYAIAENEHYTVEGNVKKNAGSYEITVALKDKDNYEWEDSTTDDRTYSFVIAKAKVVIPVEDTASFVYTGSDLTYAIAANELYTVEGNVQKAVGNYEITVALKDKDNYEWEDSTTDDLTYNFVIAKAQVAIPEEDTTNFVYTGNDLTYTIAENEHYTVDGNVKKNAGEYEVTVALKDTDNYEWEDSTIDDLTYSFVIAKAQNAIHDLSIINYKASEQGTAPTATADFGTVEYRYAKAGSSSETETMPTQAGKYTVRAFVSGTDNYDGAEATKSFTIWYADLKPAQNGNKVQIIASENGLDPEAVLVVEVVALEKAEDSEAFGKTIEDHGIDMKDKKVYGVYEAKLLINNVETQPNGKVSVRIAVPEEVKDKEFKLYHIHTDAATGKVTVSEIKCSAMAADGTVTFETDKFSQFAFVADTDCAMHRIMIAILVLFIAAFAVFGFVMKKKLYLLIACGVCGAAAIVLAFFGACTICTIFTVIDLAVIAIGTAFTCFFGKKLLGIA